MITLLNQRFVSFFFNRGGPGAGKDAEALAFVDGQTTNPWAYLAAFDPDSGKLLGETELYADKDVAFHWLRSLLDEHPRFDCPVAKGGDDAAAKLATAETHEGVGLYGEARRLFAELSADGVDVSLRAAALRGRLRIARSCRDWHAHFVAERELRALGREGVSVDIDADLERGYRLLARKDFAAARALLQPLTQRARSSDRIAEVHFAAGRACWFLDDRDWAKLHWCWIVDHLPDDRLWRRAYVAAAAEAMPYANPELGGFAAPVGNIGTQNIVDGVADAMDIYRALRPAFDTGSFEIQREVPEPVDVATTDDPVALVGALKDGNAHRIHNNEIVDRLEALGVPSIEPLRLVVLNADHRGRGYAGWALANVLIKTGKRPKAALEAMREAVETGGSYVRVLTQSGFNQLREADAEAAAKGRVGSGKSPN